MSLTDERILEILDTVEPGCVRLPLGWKLFAKAIEAEVTKTEVTMESLAFPYATLKATKPQEPVAWKGLSDVQWMNIVNHDSCYLNQDKEDAVHLAVKLTEARLKGNNTTPQPCPKCREWENKYLMEQAVNTGDDVLLSENERLKAKCSDLEALVTAENQRKQQLEAELLNKEGMTCGDCNDTGWLENREEGRYPCTCMTEAEPYQILEAKCAELEHAVFRVMNLLTRYLDDDQFNAIESIVEAAKVGPHTEIVELRAKCASLDHQVSEGHKNTLRLESVIRDFEAQTKELEASRPICSTCACEIDKAAGVDVAKLNNQIKEVEAELAQLDGVKQIAVRDTLAFRAERDALAMQNQQMREALEDCLDQMGLTTSCINCGAYNGKVELCKAHAALALPDLSPSTPGDSHAKP